jgi:nucleotide-binding universal stress UspA family protein
MARLIGINASCERRARKQRSNPGRFSSKGRPVLVVPPGWKTRAIGHRVLVCWKPTREAARAFAEADDFLARADRVTVVAVDARLADAGYGEHPGSDISTHLARRGVKVELVNLDSTGRSEAKAIQDQALAVDADLIVMGGYGRSRMSEFIFGGVTREMLKTSTVSVLMAH